MRRKKKKRFRRIQQMEPKVKIGDYEAKLKARRERAAQLKAQLDTMEVSFAKLPELTPRVSRTSSPHYLTQHGHAGKKSGRQRRQQQQATSASGSSAAQATHSTPRAASSGGGSSSGHKGSNKSSGRKNVRVTHPLLHPGFSTRSRHSAHGSHTPSHTLNCAQRKASGGQPNSASARLPQISRRPEVFVTEYFTYRV